MKLKWAGKSYLDLWLARGSDRDYHINRYDNRAYTIAYNGYWNDKYDEDNDVHVGKATALKGAKEFAQSFEDEVERSKENVTR